MMMETIRMMMVLTVLCGLIYPLAITGVAQLVFPKQARGSLLVENGRITGSQLIGQQFDDPRYFWSRPSATPSFPYNSAASSGSNLGPTNPARRKAMDARRDALQAAGPGGSTAPVPIDLITASASGLDPHISPEAAAYQARRVARVRGMPLDQVESLIRSHTYGPQFGVFGNPVVNVVLLNRDLDRGR